MGIMGGSMARGRAVGEGAIASQVFSPVAPVLLAPARARDRHPSGVIFNNDDTSTGTTDQGNAITDYLTTQVAAQTAAWVLPLLFRGLPLRLRLGPGAADRHIGLERAFQIQFLRGFP